MQKRTLGTGLAVAAVLAATVIVAMNPQIVDLFRGAVTGVDGTSSTAPGEISGYTSFLKIVGDAQGTFKGGATQTGRTDWMNLAAYNEGSRVPIDPASGLPTGRNLMSTLDVVKPIDLATPQIAKAASNGEELTVTLEVQSKMSNGTAYVSHRIELANAVIASRNVGESNKAYSVPVEHVSFAFDTIKWTSWSASGGSKTFTDDWEAPVT